MHRRLCPAKALSNWRKIKGEAAGEQNVTVIANQQGPRVSGWKTELAGFLPRHSSAGRWPGSPSFLGESLATCALSTGLALDESVCIFPF